LWRRRVPPVGALRVVLAAGLAAAGTLFSAVQACVGPPLDDSHSQEPVRTSDDAIGAAELSVNFYALLQMAAAARPQDSLATTQYAPAVR